MCMQECKNAYTCHPANPRRTDVIPPALLGDYQKLLSSAPARRLNPSKVAESKFLNNKLVDVVAFMENISVKDSLEKVGGQGEVVVCVVIARWAGHWV